MDIPAALSYDNDDNDDVMLSQWGYADNVLVMTKICKALATVPIIDSKTGLKWQKEFRKSDDKSIQLTEAQINEYYKIWINNLKNNCPSTYDDLTEHVLYRKWTEEKFTLMHMTNILNINRSKAQRLYQEYVSNKCKFFQNYYINFNLI